MVEKIRVGILISGRGSNMLALIRACCETSFPAKIAVVISNKKDALGLSAANKYNIPTAFIDHKQYQSRVDFDKKVNEILTNHKCQLVCLAGFMRILSGWFTNIWQNKLINIHPSLLPSFKGANAVRDALNYGVKYSGCTVHFVTEEMDSGSIINQEIVEIFDNDDEESLAKKILEKEHIAYKKALLAVCQKLINQQK